MKDQEQAWMERVGCDGAGWKIKFERRYRVHVKVKDEVQKPFQ